MKQQSVKLMDILLLTRRLAMLRQNQRGITLAELLATIAILSIVGVIIWSVFFQGTKYSNIAVTKNQMQQEANIIISKLTKIHQTAESYSIHSKGGNITVDYKDNNGATHKIVFDDSHLDFFTQSMNNVIPNKNDTPLTITVNEKKSNNTISIDTVLYRLKGGA